MAGVFDFGTRFGEGYMAGSQLTAQREARKAQQMNTDRDFALRESQAVIESERANLRDEMTRQGLLQGDETLRYNKQKDIDRRTFDAGEADKQRAFMGDRYKMEDKRKRREMDIDELKILQGQLQLDPGNEEIKNLIRSRINRMRSEDGMPMPAPSTAAPPQAAPQPQAAPPPQGTVSKFVDLAGQSLAAGMVNSPIEPALRGLGAVSDMFSPGPPMAQPTPGPQQAFHPMLPAQSDSRDLIPRPPQEQAYPPALLPSQGMRARPPALLPEQVPPKSSVFTRAADWLQQAVRPAAPQPHAQQSMPALAPMGGTSTSSAAGSPQEDRLFRAIVQGESRGNPNAVNPHSGAIGVGQVMPENVPVWTSEVLGKAMTPAEFKADPAAQEKVVRAKLAEYLKEGMEKTGQESEAVRYAAAKWYSGHGSLRNDSKPQKYGDGDYPSIKDYSDLVERRYLANVEQ